MFERGSEVSYANCGLPYYVGGAIAERSSLLLQTPESLHRRFRLDVRVRHEVTRIDAASHLVEVLDLATGNSSTHSYDRLVLSPGARPTVQRGVVAPGVSVMTMRTVPEADAIHAALRDPGTPVVVVGAGYTGLEAVENLVARGAAVTLVQRGKQVLSPLDPEMASPLAEEISAHGVDLRLGTTVEKVEEHVVVLSDGTRVPAAFVVDASGVTPETSLAADAGLRIGETGGIWVDSSNRTSNPDIFAVGDGVEKQDLVSGKAALVTMAGLANRHGRMVADLIAGRPAESTAALGTGVVGVFGLIAGKVGWSEKALRAAGRPHYCVHVHPSSNASYYPGAQPLAIKLIADPDTDQILGAQVVGREGVDKRIDVIATAMHAGLAAANLAQLELAYAPQFGSAKDAVNIAGYVAENTLTGTTPTLQWHELDTARSAGDVLIDVRSPREHEAGSIPGAINLPLDELRDNLPQLPLQPLVVHCQVGLRGHIATRLLIQNGFTARNLDGGYRTWVAGQRAALPVMGARD